MNAVSGMFGGGEDEEDKAKQQEQKEEERMKKHAKMQDERQAKRNSTREKHGLKCKPRVNMFAAANDDTADYGSIPGQKQPFYKRLFCGCCRR